MGNKVIGVFAVCNTAGIQKAMEEAYLLGKAEK